MKDLESHVKRRLKFVSDELRSQNPKYDQSIKFTLRLLSNYASVGRDGGSNMVKLENVRISAEAKRLRTQLSKREWEKATINEHPMPLKVMWSKWIGLQGQVTPKRIWADLKESPMVTVTKEEEKQLRSLGLSSSGDAKTRYRKAGIRIVKWKKQGVRNHFPVVETKRRSTS